MYRRERESSSVVRSRRVFDPSWTAAAAAVALAVACAPPGVPPASPRASAASTPAPAPSVQAGAPVALELQQFVTGRVQLGFDSRDDIVADAFDLFDSREDPEVLLALAGLAYERALAEHAAQERTWREPTDCDRLDRAFAELNASGIMARQRYSDCQTCGIDEIVTEAKQAIADGRATNGFVFYHEQDAEHVLDGTLHLSYGDIDGTDAGTVAIGRAAVAALQKWGLSTQWDGDTAQRIAIVELAWKRRRMTEAPAIAPRSAPAGP